MSFNRELFKNKILYRASYRGTKEMDKLMQGFVRSIIDKLDENDLEILNEFVNMDDQLLMSIKKKESQVKINNPEIQKIILIVASLMEPKHFEMANLYGPIPEDGLFHDL